jgi:hypothetical protein
MQKLKLYWYSWPPIKLSTSYLRGMRGMATIHSPIQRVTVLNVFRLRKLLYLKSITVP